MSNVLVTGASAPLGRALVRALLADERVGHVLAAAMEPDGLVPLPEERARLTYVAADLGKPREVRRLLFGPARDLAVDVVVHGALHRRARDAGKWVHAANVESTRELLHLCRRHPTITRLVYRSHAEIYRVRAEAPVLIDEEAPLDLSPRAPQWVRDRVEADLTVCAQMGLGPLRIAVLRCAECFSAGTGSQLYDYLRAPVGFRPAGFDPMLNLATPADVVSALLCAVRADTQGVFNIPGADTLPLSEAVALVSQRSVPLPGALLGPLYWLRSVTSGADFRYDMNEFRFHFSGVLDGRRARDVLGYEPTHPIDWSSTALRRA